MSPHPRLIFGGSTIGAEWENLDSVKNLLDILKTHGINEVDAAGLYPVTNMGACERLLGEAGAFDAGFQIDTKILVTSMDTDGTLETDKINTSVKDSFDRLNFQGSQKFHVVHCHGPDRTTPIEEQAAALDALHKKGMFDKLGVCNFPLDMLKQFIEVCDKKGYVKPTVYQGLYNVVARGHEALFPFLREQGITFNAHSPVASGFLSGKLTSGNIEGTRFDQDNMVGKSLKGRYDKEELHDAVRSFNKVLEPANMSIIEATLRWISYHSQLRPEDGIILGATKAHYITDNVASIKKGPLSDELVAAIDKVWDALSSSDMFYG